MPKTFFITTAIDYTNSPPHVGHAYEKILADVIARYHRLKGEKVFFLTGVDQHGQKVQQSAAKAGIPPSEFVKGITQKFIDLWKKLDVQYDEWAQTTSDRHKKVVRGILQRLFDAGQIYKDKQAGYYSVRQEQFLTDKERGPDGQFGTEWGEIEFREEENYYFKLSQHKDWLLAYLDKRKDAVIPDFRQTELRNAVEKITGDLCISRPKSRLDWGIELPFDKDFVTYVWFDALTNYISFADYNPSLSTFNCQPSTFLQKWPALQIIGKDILVPAHGIYWLIMLHAIGFPDDQTPRLLVHGWWNLSGAKMSKSAGNIVDPFVLADKYSADALRYYLMSDIATGQDADFSEERLVERYNADLANSLGNLLNRTLYMVTKYRSGKVKPVRFAFAIGEFDSPENESELAALVVNFPVDSMPFVPDYAGYFDAHRVSIVLEHVWDAVTACNTLVDCAAPWKLAQDPAQADRLDAVLYYLAESLRIIAILISPVLPKAAHGIFDQLNWKMELNGKEERFSLADAEWGELPDGHVVGKPVRLFPRIETTEL
ncbi:MAG: methionine--tRNA ligase [Verrucomicrobia bacterium]|nr:MAG: methionine--tRNA ligase [Verrucomicrobiota bacterium]